MIRVRRAAVGSFCLLALASGCSGGPERIHYDKPLPECSAFVSVLTEQGMPSPRSLATAGPGVGSTMTCVYAAAEGATPPAIATASIRVSRPTWKSDETDPAKRYGALYLVRNDCAGLGTDNPALPSGESCYQAKSPHDAFVAVSSITKQSGIYVDLQWSDAATTGDQLRQDALGKANAIAQSVIGTL